MDGVSRTLTHQQPWRADWHQGGQSRGPGEEWGVGLQWEQHGGPDVRVNPLDGGV